MGYFPNGYGEMVVRYGIVGDDEDKTVSLGFVSDLGNDAASLEAAAEEIAAEWENAFHSTGAASMTAPWELRGFRWSFRVGGVVHEGELAVPIVGTAAGESPVVHTTFLVKKLTGLAGAANKGRMFLPFIKGTDADVDTDGSIDSALVATIQSNLDAFLAAGAAGDFTLQVLHGMVLVDPGPPPVYDPPVANPVPITAFSVQGKVATQRRRLNR